MPLRRRLTVVFAVGTAVVMAAVCGLFLVTLRQGLTDNLDTALLTRASDVVTQLRSTPSSAVATESNDGIFVQILSRGGGIVDSSDVLGSQSLLTSTQTALVAARPVRADRTVDLAATPSVADGGPAALRVVAVAGPDGTLVAAGARRDGVDGAVRRAAAQLLVLSVLLVIAAALGAWLLARAALRPVETMRRQAATLGPDDDTAAVIEIPRSHDEVARLAATFNDLLHRLRVAVQREQAFVADAGHELRTPLTVLRGELELACRPGRSRIELQHTVAVAASQTERLVQLAEDLLELSRSGHLQRRRRVVDLLELLADAHRSRASPGSRRVVTVLGAVNDPPLVLGDPSSLRRALDNVIANAVRYTPDGTTVDITVTTVDAAVVITVRDHGPGFPTDFLPHAFGRFTRADPTRTAAAGAGLPPHGSGLGLAIVDDIVRHHGGTAAVCNHPSGGAVVTLTFPRSTSTPSDTRS